METFFVTEVSDTNYFTKGAVKVFTVSKRNISDLK